MKSVSHIFGGEAKVKLLRLFIFNPHQTFAIEEMALRTKEKPRKVKKELATLLKAGLAKRKGVVRFTVKKKRGSSKSLRMPAFGLDEEYPYLEPLANFLIDASPVTDKDIVKRLSRAGGLKLILLSGCFIHDPESRVDLLVVGDRLKRAQLVASIASIEAKLGREIRYAAFETPEFQYRLAAYDKLVRDILDFPHQKILNKLAI